MGAESSQLYSSADDFRERFSPVSEVEGEGQPSSTTTTVDVTLGLELEVGASASTYLLHACFAALVLYFAGVVFWFF